MSTRDIRKVEDPDDKQSQEHDAEEPKVLRRCADSVDTDKDVCPCGDVNAGADLSM